MIQILIATFGAREATRQTLEGIFQHDAGAEFRLKIYDSPASKLDGTREVLRSFSDRAEIEFGTENLPHWQALDRLMAGCESDWVVVMDSDVVILRPNWLRFILEELAEEPGAVLYGRATPPFRAGRPPRRTRGGEPLGLELGAERHVEPPRRPATIWFPRIHVALCAVRRAFIEEFHLSFAPCNAIVRLVPFDKQKYDGSSLSRIVAWRPPPDWFVERMELNSAGEFALRGDTGWQLAFTAAWFHWRFRIVRESNRVAECYRHLGSQSRAARDGFRNQMIERRNEMGREVVVYCYIPGTESRLVIRGSIPALNTLKKADQEYLVLFNAVVEGEAEKRDRVFVKKDHILFIDSPRDASVQEQAPVVSELK